MCFAQAAASLARHASVAYVGRRRLSVAYEADPTPASDSTRTLSSLLVGSMIRASTSCQNTSSRPVACSNPSTR